MKRLWSESPIVIWTLTSTPRTMSLALLVAMIVLSLTVWGMTRYKQYSELIHHSIEFLTFLATAVGISLVLRQLHESDKIARAEVTFQIVKEWDADPVISIARKTIEKFLGPYWEDRELHTIPIYPSDLKDPAAPQSRDMRLANFVHAESLAIAELRESVIQVLNFMENVAWLYQHDRLDKPMLRELLLGPMYDTHSFLRDFRIEFSQAFLDNHRMVRSQGGVIDWDDPKFSAWPILDQMMADYDAGLLAENPSPKRHWPKHLASMNPPPALKS